MKKILVGSTLLLGSFISPSSAEESKNFYLSVAGGLAVPSDVNGDITIGGVVYDASADVDNPAFYSLGIGKYFNDFRVEFNYSQATLQSDKQEFSTGGVGLVSSVTPALESTMKSSMIYVYKDFSNDSKFTPYAGLGLGFATSSSKDQTVSVLGSTFEIVGSGESVLSFALKGGGSYKISDNTSLYSEAIYQNFGSYDVTESGITTNYDSTKYFAINAGLRFSF